MSIRFIYFDLGNVLVRFDDNIACSNVAKLLSSDADTIRSAMYDSGIELQLEQGAIDEDEFLDQLLSALGISDDRKSDDRGSADRESILDAMSAMFWFNTGIEAIVSALSKTGMPLGILSNTCGPHWNWIARQQYPTLRLFTSPPILSFEVGSLKPDSRIYEAAQRMAAVPNEAIAFIDDRLENVEAAQKCGWTGIHFTDVPSLTEQLARVGLRC